jgi:hypothetical protein
MGCDNAAPQTAGPAHWLHIAHEVERDSQLLLTSRYWHVRCTCAHSEQRNVVLSIDTRRREKC